MLRESGSCLDPFSFFFCFPCKTLLGNWLLDFKLNNQEILFPRLLKTRDMVIAVSVHSCLLLKTLFSLYTWKIEVVWRQGRAWRRKKYHWRSCFLQSLYVWDVPEKETKQLRSEWVALISPFGPTNPCKKDSIDRWSTLTEVCTLALYSKLLVSSKKRTPLSGAHGFVKMRRLIRRHGHYWPTVLSDCIALPSNGTHSSSWMKTIESWKMMNYHQSRRGRGRGRWEPWSYSFYNYLKDGFISEYATRGQRRARRRTCPTICDLGRCPLQKVLQGVLALPYT